MKLTEADSETIYKLSKVSKNRLSNVEIGKQFNISEALVRYHIRRQEERLSRIAQSKAASPSVVPGAPLDPGKVSVQTIADIRASIEQAKAAGTPHEKLAPLYNSLIKSLESVQDTIPVQQQQPGGPVKIVIGQPMQFRSDTKPILINGKPASELVRELELKHELEMDALRKAIEAAVSGSTTPAPEPEKFSDIAPCSCDKTDGRISIQTPGGRCMICGGFIQ